MIPTIPGMTLPAILLLFFAVTWNAGEGDAAESDREAVGSNREAAGSDRGFEQSTVSQLQARLSDIDRELEGLASLSLRSGIGAIGYRSERFDDGDHTVWIRIDLGEISRIEQIVLVPTIWRDAKTGFRADGFPPELHVVVGNDANPDGSVVADFGADDLTLPRIAPLVIDCPPATSGSWVRVVATSLGRRLWDGRHDLQLSEIMVFDGAENIALHAGVEVSSTGVETTFINKRFLVDGHLPYLMDAKEGTKSIAFVGEVAHDEIPELVIDLEQAQTLDRIHLHAVDTSDTAPQSHGTDFAIPRQMKLIGSNHSDFSEPSELCGIRVRSIYDSGPIMMRRFDPVSCRYVALVASEPFVQVGQNSQRFPIGFAEIELFAGGRNVALSKPVTANFDPGTRGRQLAALTDGRNFYGKILPVRDWMNQLSRRQELESLRPQILSQLDRQYEKQAMHLRLARWVAATLVVLIGFVLWTSRALRSRQLASIKERFAADLHDELGANLHTIGLLSDLADESKQDPDELADYLRRIRSLTERTGIAMRSLVEMQHDRGLYTTFLADMEQAAKRIAVNLDHEIQIEGERYINQLKPRTRLDLLLFYVECLVNISRHSGATQLRTHLIGTAKEIRLSVSDNGRGLSGAGPNATPPSLRRRAKLLGATVGVEEPPSQGTIIHLALRTRRWGIHR